MKLNKKEKNLSALYLVQRVCNSMCDLLCAYFWRYFSFRNYGRGNSPQVCFVLLLVLQNSISLYSGCNRVGGCIIYMTYLLLKKCSRLCVRGTGCDRKKCSIRMSVTLKCPPELSEIAANINQLKQEAESNARLAKENEQRKK